MNEQEAAIAEKVNDVLSELAPILSAVGLTCSEPEIRVGSADPADYESELRVFILKDGDIDDVLEFHVFLDAEQQVSAEEAADWIRSDLLAIVDEGKSPSRPAPE